MLFVVLAQALVLQNARIWTGEAEARALYCLDGRVVTSQPRGATVLDLHGQRALPGFRDSHTHVLSAGLQLSRVWLKDAADEAELGRRLREFDARLPPGAWIVGGRWDHDRTLGGKLPDAALIDRYVKDRPVYVRRYDGHMAVANTAALRAAGITAETPDPSGGVVVRDANGQPTGLLRDNAMDLVESHAPPPSAPEVAAALDAALREAARVGVTALEDIEDDLAGETWRLVLAHYQELLAAGKLTARIDLWRPIAERRALSALGVHAAFGGPMLHIGTVKGYMDGSLGSSTAWMFAPYLNEPGSTGLMRTPGLPALIREADAAGLQVGVHAIGDRANAELLDAYEAAEKANGARDRRFRVEHAQHLRAQDVGRFAKLGVIASMQPYHLIDDARWAEQRIRRDVLEHSYAYRELLDSGAVLAFGTDWPVAPLDPLLGIDAAVHRRPLDGKHPEGWFPKQKITPREAVKAYTWASAYASFRERDEGTLAPGKRCDVVVLTKDVLADEPGAAVALTILGGRVVYRH